MVQTDTGGTQVLLLDLKDEPEAIAAYEAWHAPGAVPAAVVSGIRRAGITDMQIFRAGNRLVMLLATDATFDARAKAESDARDPDIQAWERLMDGFQRPIPGADPQAKWTSAARIFALHEQP
jgi:L-rhamnose mutarotase